jgi:hypothetical protein
MNKFGRILFRIARFIAGEERKEWIDAMEAEAAHLGANSIGSGDASGRRSRTARHEIGGFRWRYLSFRSA